MAKADRMQAGKATRTEPTGARTSTKKPGAKASKAKQAPKPRFDAKFLDEMRRKLLKERAKYLHSAEEYQAEAESLLATREPGDVQFDEEGGEGTTVAVERERDLALSSQARHTVSQIDAALERIDSGTYGYCVTSGAPIPVARLRAIPWAAERVEVKAGGLGRR
jgi:RNA polymerase-binding transcription factor DksA